MRRAAGIDALAIGHVAERRGVDRVDQRHRLTGRAGAAAEPQQRRLAAVAALVRGQAVLLDHAHLASVEPQQLDLRVAADQQPVAGAAVRGRAAQQARGAALGQLRSVTSESVPRVGGHDLLRREHGRRAARGQDEGALAVAVARPARAGPRELLDHLRAGREARRPPGPASRSPSARRGARVRGVRAAARRSRTRRGRTPGRRAVTKRASIVWRIPVIPGGPAGWGGSAGSAAAPAGRAGPGGPADRAGSAGWAGRAAAAGPGGPGRSGSGPGRSGRFGRSGRSGGVISSIGLPASLCSMT